jgi:predicted transcriptional regulator
MSKVAPPTVAFTEPLTSPPRVHHPGTLAKLLEVAGTRKRIVEAWGVSARTYDTRKRSPTTCTVGELQQLARVLSVSEEELLAVVRAEAASPANRAAEKQA